MKFFTILGILIGAASLTFIFQNNEEIVVKFFTYQFSGSTALVLIATLIVGLLIGLMLTVPGNVKKGLEVRKVLKENVLYKKRIEDDGIVYRSEGLGTQGENDV
jgi:uncharacterized integral membrane protein